MRKKFTRPARGAGALSESWVGRTSFQPNQDLSAVCRCILFKSMPGEFSYDVFLSHSTKHNTVVRESAERLKRDGLKVWFDEWVIPGAASRQSAANISGKPPDLKEGDGGALPRRRYEAKIEEEQEHSQFGLRNSDFRFAKPGMSANASEFQPSAFSLRPSLPPPSKAPWLNVSRFHAIL